MKLVKMAWVLGGMSAIGLGMAAQACSSSNSTADAGGGTNECVELEACCTTLTAGGQTSDATQCVNAVTTATSTGNTSGCATFLTMIQGAGLCKSSGGTGTGGTSTIPGTSGTGSSGVSSTVGTSGATSSSSPGTSAASCSGVPKTYTESKAGVYCPFATDAGKAITCAAGQECCVAPEGDSGTSPPSTCQAQGAACPVTGSVALECLEAIDCTGATGGPVCCGTGTLEPIVGCGYDKVSGFKGTTCVATGACSTYVICEQNSDCPTGSTCVPSKAYGNDFGHCSTTGT